eukprot:3179396-Prymnesium_polylepis.1
MNHSCDGNVEYSWGETCEVTITASRDIASGEELSIHYIDPCLPVAARRRQLLEGYGFVCDCRRCVTEALQGSAEPAEDEQELDEETETSEEDDDQGSLTVGRAESVHALDRLPSQRRAAAFRIRAEKCQRGPTEWRAGATASGTQYWSFTDGNGQARVLFRADRPLLSPAEWLAAGAPV